MPLVSYQSASFAIAFLNEIQVPEYGQPYWIQVSQQRPVPDDTHVKALLVLSSSPPDSLDFISVDEIRKR
jgi:hypothetical protein